MKTVKKQLLTGNEAVARGVYEAGCHLSSAYPGTPSTEIQENIGEYKEIYAEWAPNEKVALEVAAGAAMAGACAFASMKHVGLNVAADPLFTVAYTGVTGSLVINTSDEPGMHSSQNEQDNRLYAVHAKLPLIVPSDSQECLDFVKEAFLISERFDTPVLFRTTTRISHSKSQVLLGDRIEKPIKAYKKDLKKNLMIPANAQIKHPEVENRLQLLAEYAETTPLNKIEPGSGKIDSSGENPSIGIITGGIAYQYAKEVFGSSVSYLKLGFMYPFPEKLITQFAQSVDLLYIIEENEPFIENACKRLPLPCKIMGKDVLPICGELSTEIVRKAFFPSRTDTDADTDNADISDTLSQTLQNIPSLPARPPSLCPGCPHRGIFTALSRYKKHVVSTDIGCYTLGALQPLNTGDFLFCMGSSISSGMGFAKTLEIAGESKEKVIALIGDSTFFHSGITGLINVMYSGTPLVVIILDNRITAMTGHQHNPGTGFTLQKKSAPEVDIPGLVSALGFAEDQISVINPHILEDGKAALKKAMEYNGPYVIITQAPCALLPEVRKITARQYFTVDRDKCITCKACIRTGCPAISIQDGKSSIDAAYCAACGVCMQVCKPGAITGPYSFGTGGAQ